MNIGDTITVKVRNPIWERRSAYAFPIPEFNEYTGKLVPPLKWTSVDQLCLGTGNPQFPVRVIDLDRIVGMEHMAVSTKSESETWIVVGSKGSKYTVTKSGRDYSCNCTGFGFRHQCRHVNELKEKLAA